MTAASGESGEKPESGRSAGGEQMPPWGEAPLTPPSGAQEAPPIEQMPAYGGYPPPPPPYGAGFPPGGPGTFPQGGPGGFPPPPPPGFPPPGFPPPGNPPQYGSTPYPPEYGAPNPYPPNPYQGGYGVPIAEPGTNPLAIFSLVASVAGLLCGVGSVIGIVLGAIALNQIKRSRQGGYGLAVAGIVVGVASLIISLVWMIYAMN